MSSGSRMAHTPRGSPGGGPIPGCVAPAGLGPVSRTPPATMLGTSCRWGNLRWRGGWPGRNVPGGSIRSKSAARTTSNHRCRSTSLCWRNRLPRVSGSTFSHCARTACSMTTRVSAEAASVWPSARSADADRAVSRAYIASPCKTSRPETSPSAMLYSSTASRREQAKSTQATCSSRGVPDIRPSCRHPVPPCGVSGETGRRVCLDSDRGPRTEDRGSDAAGAGP